jgi:hypothetical protein
MIFFKTGTYEKLNNSTVDHDAVSWLNRRASGFQQNVSMHINQDKWSSVPLRKQDLRFESETWADHKVEKCLENEKISILVNELQNDQHHNNNDNCNKHSV